MTMKPTSGNSGVTKVIASGTIDAAADLLTGQYTIYRGKHVTDAGEYQVSR